MNNQFKVICENEKGMIMQTSNIPPDLFNFYILKKKNFKDGSALWHLGCEFSDSYRYTGGYMVLESFRGTKEEALERFGQILKADDKDAKE